jgi:hypothetical protein
MIRTLMVAALMPILSYAFVTQNEQDITNKNVEKLKELGLPTPGSGVQLVPSSQIKMPQNLKMQFKQDADEQKKNGYIQRASKRAHELLFIKNQIEKSFATQNAVAFNKSDANIFKDASEIQFAYTYIGVPKNLTTEYLGIAPGGTYVKEPMAGWTGAVEFFKTSFGDCAYTETNFMGSGGAQIDKEKATFEVNSKITLIDIEGNEKTGYLYQVNWFDNIANHNLECAMKTHSDALKKATVKLAKAIDKA